jgi:exonuclease SbcD
VTRIAFTADLHVDAYGSRVDPSTGLNARLADYIATLRFVAAEARRRGCEALVVAGDFTERRHPAPWLVSKIKDALETSPAPAQRFYLRGNHDGERAGGSIVSVLNDDESSFGVSAPELMPIGDVVLACIPYLDRHWLRAQPDFEAVPDDQLYRVLGEQFVAIAGGLYAKAKADPEYAAMACVLVCHQTLAGGQMSESQQAFLGDVSLVVDARALQAIGFEGVVAGHLHRHQVVLEETQRSGAGVVLYTGSIERVDFGEEHETKGFVVADVGPGRFDWRFIETPARRFVTLHSLDPVETGEVSVDGAIVRLLDAHPEEDPALYRKALESFGAFEVTEVRRRPDGPGESVGGLDESLTAEQALEEYFAGDHDREVLVARGREILAEVAA